MRIVIIPDLHGLDGWHQPAKDTIAGKYDKIVFLGDYCDSYNHTNEQILTNLLDIIKLKDKLKDRCVTLIGNHELHYMMNPPHVSSTCVCSGYRGDFHNIVWPIFKKNFNKFEAIHQQDACIFSHAGIHKGWFLQHYGESENIHPLHVADVISNDFKERKDHIFDVGYIRGGSKPVGGIFWADKKLTSKKPLEGAHQFVGHTPVKMVSKVEIDETTSITYCDCLQTTKQFKVINTNNYLPF